MLCHWSQSLAHMSGGNHFIPQNVEIHKTQFRGKKHRAVSRQKHPFLGTREAHELDWQHDNDGGDDEPANVGVHLSAATVHTTKTTCILLSSFVGD